MPSVARARCLVLEQCVLISSPPSAPTTTLVRRGMMNAWATPRRRPAFDTEPAFEDEHGNRICQRELPDGSKFDVVRNSPDASEMRDLLKEHAQELQYANFAALDRWMTLYLPLS